jgi:hypothetical protein
VLVAAAGAAQASTVTWGCGIGADIDSCLGIVPIDPDLDPAFHPEGSASFHVEDGELRIVLTSTSPEEPAAWAALSGLSFDVTLADVTLTGVSATAEALVPVGGSLDIGAEWGFGSFGFADFGIASVGTINGVDAGFGGVCISGPCAQGKPNGVDYSIVGPSFEQSNAGFANANNQPVVQSQVTFVFDIGGTNADTFTMADIANVTPYFGTNGAPIIPEPRAVALYSIGLLVTGLVLRRSGRR